ncbi:MAG: glucuronate isomerase [Faecalibacterium sp.]
MKAFMDENFLLNTPTAQHLYHDYAAEMPICDYHCHISPKEIAEDRRFENITQLWLGGKTPEGGYAGDHYKWRVIRSNGVPEELVTGSAPDRERFQSFAEALPMAIGNPMYHWAHYELKTYFGYEGVLNGDTAEEVWNLCNEKLANDVSMSVRGLIRQSNVAFIGTTDDPIDSLEWHEKIAADPDIEFIVAPSFRPDKAINIQKDGFVEYIAALAACVGKDDLATVQDVLDALSARVDYFAAHGCKASDHGLDYIPYRAFTMSEVEEAYQAVRAGKEITTEAAEQYQSAVLLMLGRAYHKHDIAMQLHYSAMRNNNTKKFREMGPDTGYDAIGIVSCGQMIAGFLSALDETDECPKTIIYSLNPADDAQIGSLIGCFQGTEVAGKIQAGSAWWFCDQKVGMQNQMISLANLGLLGNFIGMLTDSRSFLSYTRHAYFRRILCNLVGQWVEDGEYPNDEKALETIIRGISFNNAKRYFGF